MKQGIGKTGRRTRALSLAVALAILAPQAYAARIETSSDNVSVRWDNTFKYSGAIRVKDRSDALTTADPFSVNSDDGNRNFDKGLVSNRLDWLTELDVVVDNRFGFRLSGAAWYDDIYNGANDHDAPDRANQPGAHNRFNRETRDLHGRKAELLDAFVFGSFDIGDTRLNLRAGQHSVLWGETLFFGANGIAGAMAPVDVIKLASVPGTQFKEAIRPVPQISAQWQLGNVSLGAFYQFRWEANRLPAAGSYFSSLDFQPEGGEFMYLGPMVSTKLPNMKAKNSGQGGVSLRFTAGETDFGIYAVRFHNKSHQVVNYPGLRFLPDGSLLTDPTGAPIIAPINFQLAYNEDITTLGVSASRTFGAVQLSAEASVRDNQDLAASGAVDLHLLGAGPVTNNSDTPAYAVGKTAHFNLSTMWSLPSTPLMPEAMFMGEIMWNRVLSVDEAASSIDPNSTRDATALRFILEPTYRQVLPGLDLSVPFGVGYSPKGSRSQALGPSLPADNGGDVSIGLNGSYLDVWRFSLAYNHFFGEARPLLGGESPVFTYGQFMKDRNFIAFSVRRSF